ncbi:alpha/beta hydrolase [Pirellulales bacterium]|nr:alpha/beta hydrolase [Pirellulales bacterium]
MPCLDGMLQCAAEEAEKPSKQFLTDRKEKKQSRQWVIPIPTFGGLQVWTAHSYRQGYQIQHNAVTDNWRLLDGNDRRWMWGTREQCEAFLNKVAKRSRSKLVPQRCIVLVHGLMRTKHSMTPLTKVLQKKCDCEIISFSYASTRGNIGEHAAALQEFLESLPESWTLSFVGHSMGNIVIRHLIADLQDDQKHSELLSRCQRMVMLGPPNQGAAIARQLSSLGMFEWIAGEGAMELGPDWDEFSESLAIPPFPFSIVAGEVENKAIQNPLLDNASDFVVEVDEARLEGSESFVVVPALHSFLMKDAQVQEFVVDFLCH